MGLFSKKYEGIIGYFHLEQFWDNLTTSDHRALIKYYRSGMGADPNGSPIEGSIGFTSDTAFSYLSRQIAWAVADKNWLLAEKIIQYVEPLNARTVERHFFYANAADCFYKQIKMKPEAIEKAIYYCLLDIQLFPTYRGPLVRDMGELPRIASFQMLAMCYEKQGEYEKAIAVCKDATRKGLRENTKSGFPGRIVRLEKKLKNSQGTND